MYLNKWQRDLRTLMKLKRKGIFRDAIMCVEGYPRSANSLIEVTMQVLDPELWDRTVDHTHNRSVVRHAIRLGIPTAVLIREPRDAAASLLVYYNRVEVDFARHALRWWIHFYKWLEGYTRDDVVVIPFEQVTRDVNVFMDAMERQFGLELPRVDDAADMERRTREMTERRYRETGRDMAQFPFPHGEKPSKDEALKRVDAHPELLARARQLHRRILERHG